MKSNTQTKNETNNYFGKAEENAVNEYVETFEIYNDLTNQANELEERLSCYKKDSNEYNIKKTELDSLNKAINELSIKNNNIFNQKLNQALTKMIESIIRRYNLYVPDETSGQTFSDTISYLMTKIKNFKPGKGKKAYSYCGTVCKNYLLYKKIQFDKQQFRNVKYEDECIPGELEYAMNMAGEKDEFYYASEKIIDNITKEITKMVEDPEANNLTEQEVKVGLAIVELLKNWEKVLPNSEDSNKLQKSSVLYFLREQTLMTTKEVRDNMKKFKTAYAIIKKQVLDY